LAITTFKEGGFLRCNKTKKKEANRNRKKAEVKGGRFAAIILPAIKVLPKNKATRNSFRQVVLFFKKVFKISPNI